MRLLEQVPVLIVLVAVVTTAGATAADRASSDSPAGATAANGASSDSPPGATIVLVGSMARDRILAERVQSLFDPNTRVTLTRQAQLSSRDVLEPAADATVYLWMTRLSPTRARIYLAVREAVSAPVRYLLRDVELDNGLDELGSETLAQIAHSSATALWAQKAEVPRQQVQKELQRLATLQGALVSTPNGTVSIQRYELTLGLQLGSHVSGDEGWRHEPGAFLNLVRDDRVSAGLSGSMLVPTRFDTPRAEIRLSGFSSEARCEWRLGAQNGPLVVPQFGLGLSLTQWSARGEIGIAQGEKEGQDWRAHAVAGLGIHWALDPFFVAGALELRMPFQRTAYDYLEGGQRVTLAQSWLLPGAMLRVGTALTRF